MVLTYHLQKRGVVATQFQWLFVLIAGALILFFFISGALTIRSTEQAKIALEGVQNIDTLFMAALVDEQVTRFVTTPGTLNLEFMCNLDAFDPLVQRRTLVSTYGLPDEDLLISSNNLPVFSPSSLSSSTFILHSSPFTLPFRVDRSLYLTSYEHQFILFEEGILGGSSTEYLSSLFPENVSVTTYVSFDTFLELPRSPGGDYTFILATTDLTSAPSLSDTDRSVLDELSSRGAVHLRLVDATSQSVGFFTYKAGGSNSQFRPQGSPVTYVDDGTLLGSFFTETSQQYSCTVEKLQRRYVSVAELHAARYATYAATTSDVQCRAWYLEAEDQINRLLNLQKSFYEYSPSDIEQLSVYSNQLMLLRNRIEVNSCPSLF